MLKIGEFSKSTGMTIKALRHYENLGLIRPYWVDKYTGYRYYDETQVERLRKVIHLKGLGFTLRQVGRLLDGKLPEAERLNIIENQRAVLRQQLETSRERLARLEAYVQHINQQSVISEVKLEVTMTIEIKSIPAFKVAGLLYVGRNENEEISGLWERLNARWDEFCPNEVEAVYGVCRSIPSSDNGDFEYLAGVACESLEGLPADAVMREVPACDVAVFRHVGAKEGLHQTYEHIYWKHLPGSGYMPLEPGFDMEVYTDEFKGFSPDSVMYIYVPVKPRL
ncbi:MAG TPA: MerR family transcriptional regulator [Anaerolineaceae bacterium]|nr:MerR family transcriptional regulator [Anaerolineaceae bacterium]